MKRVNFKQFDFSLIFEINEKAMRKMQLIKVQLKYTNASVHPFRL